MRVGQGFDVHKFGPGDKIVIGGVVIPFEKGLIAHSDGDVLLHAICDALLGAAGLGDIGQHFPDTDPQFRDVNSRTLLRLVVAKIRAEGWTPVNCDSTIIAEKPYMARHIPFMRENLAADLDLELNAVNVKATTSEGLGFAGRQEGIAAQAGVLLTVLSS